MAEKGNWFSVDIQYGDDLYISALCCHQIDYGNNKAELLTKIVTEMKYVKEVINTHIKNRGIFLSYKDEKNTHLRNSYFRTMVQDADTYNSIYNKNISCSLQTTRLTAEGSVKLREKASRSYFVMLDSKMIKASIDGITPLLKSFVEDIIDILEMAEVVAEDFLEVQFTSFDELIDILTKLAFFYSYD